jgi:hypothetical protein
MSRFELAGRTVHFQSDLHGCSVRSSSSGAQRFCWSYRRPRLHGCSVRSSSSGWHPESSVFTARPLHGCSVRSSSSGTGRRSFTDAAIAAAVPVQSRSCSPLSKTPFTDAAFAAAVPGPGLGAQVIAEIKALHGCSVRSSSSGRHRCASVRVSLPLHGCSVRSSSSGGAELTPSPGPVFAPLRESRHREGCRSHCVRAWKTRKITVFLLLGFASGHNVRSPGLIRSTLITWGRKAVRPQVHQVTTRDTGSVVTRFRFEGA